MLYELAIAFVIVGICLAINMTGMVILADWLVGRRARIDQHASIAHSTLVLMMVFTVIIFLHLADAFIWAGFYSWRGLFPDYETSVYFSLVSYATIGYGDVVLPRAWRLLGTIEGISGVLLCGLSTAFLFAIVNAFIRARIQRLVRGSDVLDEAVVPGRPPHQADKR